ncbi:CRM1 protein [Teladorsagia circumcincta]|uniref:CRM1 protein n=1 Tax=Teladorsagia circumcincta TaxID=45464 RepID=A0A2G9V4E0_TELCI|nr:CRM1 protein [Teladorsagia circumcincta]
MAALTATPMVILEEAKKQFQGDGKLNVQLLDQVVTMMNRATGEEQKLANMILVELKENPNSWTKIFDHSVTNNWVVDHWVVESRARPPIGQHWVVEVDAILEYSDLAESKYFALQILESVIQTKWKSLPLVQRDGIKGFIVQFILKLTNSIVEATLKTLHRFLSWIPVGYVFETDITQLLSENTYNSACPQVTDYHKYAIELLLSISQVEDVEIFKVCLDYWCALTSELYRLNPFAPPSPPIAISFSCGGAAGAKEHPRRKLYKEHLSNLRTIMISRMAKPEEVLVVREIVKDTDSITLYKNMRECLVYLTHLDCKDTEQKMTDKLASQMQVGEQTPFIDEMLKNLSGIICDLAPSQVHVFYEAVGHIISSASDEPDQQADLIEKLMALPNSVWDEIIANAGENMAVLEDAEVSRNLLNILKTNVACCKAAGNPFITQLSRLYIDLLSLYRILSEKVSTAVEQNGQEVLKMPLLKTMRAVKREILILISTWVASAKDRQMVLENIVPPLFDAVLFDYQKNVPAAREPKVLSLLSIIVTKLGSMLASQVPQILAAVFECTLEMINKDMEAFPEHRTNFFQLIHALTVECFQIFLALPPEQLSYIIDAVVWAFQHSMRNVAEIGLTYYAEVLCRLFKACEFLITVPLNDDNPKQSNVDYIYEYIANIFVQHFTNLTEGQIRVIIKGFFSFNTDQGGMRNHLRDFLVQIKEFNGEDTSDLFLEEREAEIQAVQAKKNAVPGMLDPNAMVDEDEMR